MPTTKFSAFVDSSFKVDIFHTCANFPDTSEAEKISICNDALRARFLLSVMWSTTTENIKVNLLNIKCDQRDDVHFKDKPLTCTGSTFFRRAPAIPKACFAGAFVST